MDDTFTIIFAGTPAFSVKTLDALLHSRHKVSAVYTQPDRPAGRGRKITPSPVKEMALQHQLPVYQPLTLRDPTEQQIFAELKADLMIVVAYGLILPLPILQTPSLGCLNVHASLLPRWRGAAPIQRAILAGDPETGVTIMQMNQGLDTGDMLYKKSCLIHAEDTSATLHDKLAILGANALIHTLDHLAAIQPEKQNDASATYAQKISKEEAAIDWSTSAEEIARKIRAFNPWPVATCRIQDEMIRIWQARVVSEASVSNQPGRISLISPQGIQVETRLGILQIEKMQFPGGRVLAVSDVLNARHNLTVGDILK